ncbi:PREDICTED: G-box-binding factor 3-like isoform X1 [Lupinus angustifolius]|uniref:G-box-binding factor 3-like isoform X1 n=1 Tax=Lupinus angustifolius TaxID=3871 RepID=UPI00092F6B5C|nr:PREDICTED: G-box-binding factor 3-like isoform X1 [Lupinus angustifolius]XP_019418063.1 PREDICTED: G-box-binding factor 3-like isoform X1 [Lupinus angustifolius]
MGNSEEEKSTKTENPPSPVTMANGTNPTNIHVYPDWAAMQAYYGPRVAVPPYYNSAVASGHTPHPYMWGPPQPMMPPYGPPYAAMYPHGGVYAHPGVPIGPPPHGQGVPSSPAVGTPLSIEKSPKSSGNADQGLMKKLKGFGGLAMSIGNGHAESAERGLENMLSQSGDTEGSSGGSDSNTSGANETRRRKGGEGTPTTDENGKTEMQVSPASEEATAASKIMSVVPAGVAGKLAGPSFSLGTTTTLELTNPSGVRANSTSAPQPCAVLPPEAWVQNERELKRERRKQSNRESARRSRLRKQAESEELALKVEALNAENVTLKSEMKKLAECSEKLRAENATLKEKLKHVEVGETEEIMLKSKIVSTENLLSTIDRSVDEENGFCEKKHNNSGAKLHQLLNSSPRADAVVAG